MTGQYHDLHPTDNHKEREDESGDLLLQCKTGVQDGGASRNYKEPILELLFQWRRYITVDTFKSLREDHSLYKAKPSWLHSALLDA